MITRIANLRPTTLFLLAANGLLLLLFLTVIRVGNQSEQILAAPAEKTMLSAFNVGFQQTRHDFAIVSTKALFYSTREFYVPPNPTTQAPVTPKPNYRLSGTLHTPQKGMIAMLVKEGGTAVRKVMAGDDLDGWQVRVVEPNRIVLGLGTENVEIGVAKPINNAGFTVMPLTRRPEPDTATRVLGGGSPTSSGTAESGAITQSPRLYHPPPN